MNRNQTWFPSFGVLLFYCFSAVAADLDFLIGWYFGNINQYHHQFSHSIVMAILYGMLVYLAILICQKLWVSKVGSPGGSFHGELQRSPSDVQSDSRFCALFYGSVGGFIYFGHLILDLLTVDQAYPIGMQLFWPFSDAYVIAPLTPFPSVQHHAGGSNMLEFVKGILVSHNLRTVLMEVVILSPVYGLVLYLKPNYTRWNTRR